MLDKETPEQKLNNYVKKFLKINNFITEEDNIVHMEKAFVAGSVLKHALLMRKNQKMNDKELNLFFRALSDYKDDKINLFWDDGEIKFVKILKEGANDELSETQSGEENQEDPDPPRTG